MLPGSFRGSMVYKQQNPDNRKRMMKRLWIIPLLLLAACAPSTSAPPPSPEPKVTTLASEQFFTVQVLQDGREVTVTPTPGGWLLDASSYALVFNLSPQLSYITPAEKNRYNTWRSDSRNTVAASRFLLSLLSSQPKQLSFRLDNKALLPLRVLWDESRFVLLNRTESPVLHKGVAYTDIGRLQAPTLVGASSRLEDYLLPTQNVRFIAGLGWTEAPLFDNTLKKGQTLSARLVFEVRGQRVEVDMRFTASADFAAMP